MDAAYEDSRIGSVLSHWKGRDFAWTCDLLSDVSWTTILLPACKLHVAAEPRAIQEFARRVE